jgi:hypothetical protein
VSVHVCVCVFSPHRQCSSVCVCSLLTVSAVVCVCVFSPHRRCSSVCVCVCVCVLTVGAVVCELLDAGQSGSISTQGADGVEKIPHRSVSHHLCLCLHRIKAVMDLLQHNTSLRDRTWRIQLLLITEPVCVCVCVCVCV